MHGAAGAKSGTLTAIAQPGLRYAQADALVESLMRDEAFAGIPLAERGGRAERLFLPWDAARTVESMFYSAIKWRKSESLQFGRYLRTSHIRLA